MTSLVGRFALAVGGLLTASGMAVLATSPAYAYGDALVGKTYEEAVSMVKSWKAKPFLATVVGDGVELNKCIVTSSRKDMKTAKVFLSVYCNSKYATTTDSGHSLASPEGHAAWYHDEGVKWLQTHPDLCRQYMKDHPDWFKPKVLEGCEGVTP